MLSDMHVAKSSQKPSYIRCQFVLRSSPHSHDSSVGALAKPENTGECSSNLATSLARPSRVSFIPSTSNVVLTLALYPATLLLILAAADALPGGVPASTCSTGSLQCCQSFKTVEQASLDHTLDLLGIKAGDVDGDIGIQCSPLNVVLLGDGACSASNACCQSTTIGGVGIGCVAIS
ncbi:hypothetical protein C8Q76DRAFT_692603 [Earliella scabrosa]|nr:hypothetical protein C8Q76DRAFT_692603 [Earliella scabrosa]